MILGKATKLQSQFRLTYNMILNLLRVEALKVEEMIKRSFSENASQRLLPDQQKVVIQVTLSVYYGHCPLRLRFQGEKKLAVLPKLECDVCSPDIEKFYDISSQIVNDNRRMVSMLASTPQGSKSLSAGRVVVLHDEVTSFFVPNDCPSDIPASISPLAWVFSSN